MLKVKDLSVKFGDFPVVENVGFEVERGESLAIVGPNGSGKTTLLRALIDQVPYTGVVEWEKEAKIAYVPQRVDLEKNLPLTVEDFLMAKIKTKNLPLEEMAKVLTSVNLAAEIINKRLGQLSAGQLQRVLVAFALISGPNVILLDEPTAEVDLPGEELLYDMLHRLQDLQKATLLIVSHDLSLVFRYATKVVCMNRRMLCYGTPKEVLTTEHLYDLYGGSWGYYHHAHGEKNLLSK